MSTPDCGLIVFLRLPVKGKVKTRIAATAGIDNALRIYNQLTTITLNLASSLEIPAYLFYEGGLPEEGRKNSFYYFEQAGGDLGRKMETAIQLILQKHSKAIIIGSDCPELSAGDIYLTIHQLEGHDFVIGPATDGGFYLLGCKKFLPGMFEDIQWSTPQVRDSLIKNIEAAGSSCQQLRMLHDIDVEEDWIRYSRSNP